MVVGAHQVFKSGFYGGSRLLVPLADRVGLQIDQVNFVACQLIALAFAFPFRKHLSPNHVSVVTRHIVEVLVGLLLCIFCFGYQIWHLVIQSSIAYALMMYGGPRFSHSMVFVWCILYLSMCHIYRQVYDYGGWTMDITGALHNTTSPLLSPILKDKSKQTANAALIPLMIQTQKITALAFALHDGRYKDRDDLTEDQRNQAVRKMPNMLEYMSFMFYFHGIMVGPNTFYNDYISFIDGSNFKVGWLKRSGSQGTPAIPVDSADSIHPASLDVDDINHPIKDINKIVAKKMLVACICAVSMLVLPGLLFPPEYLHTPYWYSMSFMSKIWFLLGCMTLSKNKYYFAWKLSDAINNAAGFGFSGYDEKGNAVWDLTDNVDIRGVELSTSLKINIDSWNKKTLLWLRRVVYDRVETNATLAVFSVSALWHGFYPGYYITFFGGAACISTSRMVRRNIRPYFQTSAALRKTYDCITFVLTRLANSYLCFPFLVLEFYACFFMYKSMYFYLHILTLVTYLMMIVFAAFKGATTRAGSQSALASADKNASSTKPGTTSPNDTGSRAGSQAGSRVGSQAPSQAGSKAVSQAGSKAGSKAPSVAPSRAASADPSRQSGAKSPSTAGGSMPSSKIASLNASAAPSKAGASRVTSLAPSSLGQKQTSTVGGFTLNRGGLAESRDESNEEAEEG